MSLQTRLADLITAIGADIKSLQSSSVSVAAPLHEEWTQTATPPTAGLQGAGPGTKDTANSNASRVSTPSSNIFTITNPNNYDETWEIDGLHNFPAIQNGRAFFGFRLGSASNGTDLMRAAAQSGEQVLSGSMTVRVPANSSFTFGVYQYIAQAAYTTASTTRIKFTLVTNKGAVGSAQEIASSVLNTNYAVSGTAVQTITSWPTVTVPAGVAADIEVKGGVLCSIATGTNASTVQQTFYLRIVDDLGTVVGFSQYLFYGTGVSQQLNVMMPFGCSLDAQAADRTYHFEVRYVQQGVSGASATVVAGSPFPRIVAQALKR